MKSFVLLIPMLVVISSVFSQVSIGSKTPDPSAMLEVNSKNKGLLIPRLTASD